MFPLILGLFAGLFYLGNSEVRRFENLAANDIKAKLSGPNRRVTVRSRLNGLAGPFGDLRRVTISASNFETEGLPLFTEPQLSKKGIIHELRIELKEFRMKGLLVQALTARIPDCRFDYNLALNKRKIRLSQSGTGRGEVSIREGDLEAFILKKFHEIKRVSVHVAGGKVFVDGYGEFLILKTAFSVEASLSTSDGTKLELTDAKISFDGQPAEEAARKVLLDTLNPVVDLNKDLNLYNAVKVDSITLKDGVLRASGSAKIPDAPTNTEALFGHLISPSAVQLAWLTRPNETKYETCPRAITKSKKASLPTSGIPVRGECSRTTPPKSGKKAQSTAIEKKARSHCVGRPCAIVCNHA